MCRLLLGARPARSLYVLYLSPPRHQSQNNQILYFLLLLLLRVTPLLEAPPDGVLTVLVRLPLPPKTRLVRPVNRLPRLLPVPPPEPPALEGGVRPPARTSPVEEFAVGVETAAAPAALENFRLSEARLEPRPALELPLVLELLRLRLRPVLPRREPELEPPVTREPESVEEAEEVADVAEVAAAEVAEPPGPPPAPT